MAKMIKCPTCGTQIEVQQADGQIIKCPGCGKGLKLVAKKPPGAGAQAPRDPGGSSQGSVAGSSVSAMSYHGEPPPLDDLPSLDSNCAVCGRPTDPSELIEDNGRLVCPDCVKGARSSIDRPAGGADLLEFKPPVPAPPRRAPILNVTPTFILACLAGLVWASCQIYLNLVEKPKGSVAVANVPPKPGDATTVTPTPPETPTTQPGTSEQTSPAPAAMQPTPPDAVAGVPQPPEPSPPPPGSSTTKPGPTTVALAPTESPGSRLFPPDDTTQPPTVQPPTVPPEDVTPPVPSPPIATDDPIELGLDRLAAKDYQAAKNAFDVARKRYLVAAGRGVLTPQQAVTYEGLAAADLGLNKPEDARARLDTAFERGDRSRALVLNRAIATVMSKVVTGRELDSAWKDLKAYLDSHPDDSYAADICGTLVARFEALPGTPKAALEPVWTYLDVYNDRAAKDHEGQLKWGVEWIDAEAVRRYRLLRSKADNLGVKKALRDLENAKAKYAIAERNHQLAVQGRGGDVVGLKNQMEIARKTLAAAQAEYEKAEQIYKMPRWLEKFDPVIPEPPLPAATPPR